MNFKLFLHESWKNQFFSSGFREFEIVIWELASLAEIYERVHLLLKNWHVPDCQNSWRYKKLLLVANQSQNSTFLFEINRVNIGISKLVLFKLFPSFIWA